MRQMLLAGCVLGLPLVAGCGLVVLPTFREFPGPVKSVRVVDAATKERVAGANVQVQINRLDNWFVQMPMLLEAGSEAKGRWKPLQEVDGAFTMKRTWATGWARIWLPLPPVLGPALLDEPYAHLRVTAPGHQGLVYVYSPRNPPRPGAEACKEDMETPADARFDEHGVLTIYLLRKPPEAATGPCR